jgi:hypothetical protein
MAKIFISYRRNDTSGWVQHLATDLQARFGRDAVFVDIDKIGAGSDFVLTIEKALAESSVMLAVIGPRWLGRLEDPNDFVRLELSKALQRNVYVIPVLVGNAAMPKAEELPDELRILARRQAFEISDKRRAYDFAQLCGIIETYLPGSSFRRRAREFLRWGAFALAAALIIVAAGVLYWPSNPKVQSFSPPADQATLTIRPTEITRAPPYYPGEFAYRYVGLGVTMTHPDTGEAPSRSRLLLLENGQPLFPAHSPRAEIYQSGRGRYSHFSNGQDTDLVFSTSDNSDPRSNNRVYTLALSVNIPPSKIDKGPGPYLYQYFGPAARITAPDSVKPKSHTSNLRLFEDGKPLWPPHAPHEEIARDGMGRYSHWIDDIGDVYINFSSSDKSDPRNNGRTYSIAIEDK